MQNLMQLKTFYAFLRVISLKLSSLKKKKTINIIMITKLYRTKLLYRILGNIWVWIYVPQSVDIFVIKYFTRIL